MSTKSRRRAEGARLASPTRKRIETATFLILALLTLLFAHTAFAYRTSTDATAYIASEARLRNLGERIVANLGEAFDARCQTVEEAALELGSLETLDAKSLESLLERKSIEDGRATFGVERAADPSEPSKGGSASPSEEKEIAVGEGSFRVSFADGTATVSLPIAPLDCEGDSIVSVFAAVPLAGKDDPSRYELFAAAPRSCIVDEKGICVIPGPLCSLERGSSIYDDLEENAVFREGGAESIRSALSPEGAGAVSVIYAKRPELLRFEPLGDTGWHLCTVAPSDAVIDRMKAAGEAFAFNISAIVAAAAGISALSLAMHRLFANRDERVFSEERVRAAHALSEARQASSAKSEFLSRMSHEIRTPLNGIMGMIAIARQSIGDDERVIDCLDKADLSSRHLLSLINDILDMSKIESGRMEVKREEFRLGALAESSSSVFRTQALQRGLRYEVSAAIPKEARFLGDELRLNQIVYNLVGNAFKFTPAGGSVELAIDEAGREGSTSLVRFSVSDTGCGIEPEHLSRIFDPFEQGGGDTARLYGGTGLGLAISKRLVELMGGSISVSSAVGCGSVFVVEVPLERVERSEGESGPQPSAPTGRAPAGEGRGGTPDFSGRRILIAEDNALNREIAVELLRLTGADIDEAETGADALSAFSASPPGTYDLILMDVQMPVMDGYGATRAIRVLDRPDARSVPIVAMTANAFAEDRRRSRESGMDGHLSKPLDIQLVYDTMERFLDGGGNGAGRTRGNGR